MDLIEKYLSRSQEIIGDRARAETRYDNGVALSRNCSPFGCDESQVVVLTRLLPAVNALFPVGTFLFKLLGSGCLDHDVASLDFSNIMPRFENFVKMGLN